MTNVATMRVEICGTRPLLWHFFGPDAIPLEKGEKTGVAGNDPEEWRKTVLLTGDRQLYLLPTYAFACIREAAKYTKKNRSSLQGPVAATLEIAESALLIDRHLPAEPLPVNDPTLPVYLDVRSVRNPTTKGRNVRYRVAAAPGWRTTFTLTFDRTIVSRPEMQAIVNDAGRLVGLGDARSIGFGRFVVEGYQESAEAA